jgi:hypothetical protein
VLEVFRDSPETVRWELTNDVDRGCRLVVHHAHGSWVETFVSTPQALRRVQDLEDMLARARKK